VSLDSGCLFLGGASPHIPRRVSVWKIIPEKTTGNLLGFLQPKPRPIPFTVVLREPGLNFGTHGLSFRWGARAVTSTSSECLSIPVIYLACVVFVPFIMLRRLDTLARRRARLNHCPTCNYDRTGLPAASRCPECGAVAAGPAPAKT
jgi:hypothetical protein